MRPFRSPNVLSNLRKKLKKNMALAVRTTVIWMPGQTDEQLREMLLRRFKLVPLRFTSLVEINTSSCTTEVVLGGMKLERFETNARIDFEGSYELWKYGSALYYSVPDVYAYKNVLTITFSTERRDPPRISEIAYEHVKNLQAIATSQARSIEAYNRHVVETADEVMQDLVKHLKLWRQESALAFNGGMRVC